VIGDKLKVFCVGSDWFLREMKDQRIDVSKIEWTPEPEKPADIVSILKKIGD
jgi:hypothetical protein